MNNINNAITSPNPFISTFTPTDTPAWILFSGTYVSNSQAITNALGVVENSAQKLTLSAATGSNRDMFIHVVNNYSGQTLVLSVWVLSGTATNFDITITNGLTWNSPACQCLHQLTV